MVNLVEIINAIARKHAEEDPDPQTSDAEKIDRMIADVREACGPSGDPSTLDPIKLAFLMDTFEELRDGPAPEPRKEKGDVPTYSSSVGALRLALKIGVKTLRDCHSGARLPTEDQFFVLAWRVHAFISTTDHKDL